MLVLDHGLGKVSSRAAEHVFLLPGQWYFGTRGELVRTLLGSCVALTLWHPVKRCGGMCHFLLPDRQRSAHAELDGRYGDEAMELLAQAMLKVGTRPEDYLVELYGGADTMPDQVNAKLNVGERNIEKALGLIDQYKLQLSTVDVGGNEPRNVALDMRSGQVQLRRGRPHTAKPAPKPGHAAGGAHGASHGAARAPHAAPTHALHKPHASAHGAAGKAVAHGIPRPAHPAPHAKPAGPVGHKPLAGKAQVAPLRPAVKTAATAKPGVPAPKRKTP